MGVHAQDIFKNTGKMRAERPDLGTYNMARTARPRIAPPRTWEDAVTRFIDHHRTRRRSELTLRWYRADLDLFTAWHKESRGEEPDLATIDGESLLDFMDHLKGRAIGAKGPTTRKEALHNARKPKPAT